MGNPRFKFTLSHPVAGTKVISEPDGWKDVILKLERHAEFHSLIEYFEGGASGGFIFYGSNGVKDGGVDFILNIDRAYGFIAIITMSVEISFDDGLNYIPIFTGDLDLEQKKELPDNKVMVPVIQQSVWNKFISRLETPVSLSSTTDLDGNVISAVDPIDINLTSQKVKQKFSAYLDKTSGYPGLIGKEITDALTYVQFDWNIVTFDEIEEKFDLPILDNASIPVNIFKFKYGGTYRFDITIDIADDSLEGSGPQVYPSTYLNVFIKFNEDSAVSFTETNVVTIFAPLITRYTYSGLYTFQEAGGEVTIYGQRSSADQFSIMYQQFNSVESQNFYNKIDIVAETIFPSSEVKGYFLHDAMAGVIQRITGQNCFYSPLFGRIDTNMRTYPSNGCFSAFAVLKGFQARGFSLEDKPASFSLMELWRGANTDFNLGLGYDTVNGEYVINVDRKSAFYDDASRSHNLGELRPTRGYDSSKIFKLINIGNNQWQTEEASGLDDPQTKHSYATKFDKGVELTLYSPFVQASYVFELLRRAAVDPSKDNRYDNDTLMLHVNDDDVSPDRYRPELNEQFTSISNLNNTDTRYNLILTPLRKFLRWANYFNGCMQRNLSVDAYKFVKGEGNYDMESDYNCATGQTCLAMVCDNLSEKQNINLSLYGSGLGFIHLPDTLDFSTRLSWEGYLSIRANRKKAVGISLTTSNFKRLFINKLEYELARSKVTVNGWLGENVDLVVPVSEQPAAVVCEPPPPEPEPEPVVFDEDYQAILDYATGQGYSLPSDEQQILQNTLLVELKAIGAWDDLDILYVFATNGDSDFAKINWKNPGTFNCTEVNAPTFTVNEGFLGNGTTSYLNTGWDPSNNGVNYTQNEGGWFIHINNEPAASNSNYAFGTSDGLFVGQTILLPKTVSNNHGFSLNSLGPSVGSSVSAEGFYHGRRTASNDLRLYKNGSQAGATSTETSNGLATDDVYICAQNGNGSANEGLCEISVFAMGASLTGKESDLYNAWNDYLNAL